MKPFCSYINLHYKLFCATFYLNVNPRIFNSVNVAVEFYECGSCDCEVGGA